VPNGDFEKAARAHIASRGARGTRRLYKSDLTRWLAFCEQEKASPDEPTIELATKFRDELMATVEAQTVRRVLSALSSMYEAAGLPNLFKSSKRLPRPSPDDVALTREFSLEEIDELFEAVLREEKINTIGLRDEAIFRLLYDTGLRVSSVTSLLRDQVYARGRDGVWVAVVKVKKRGLVEVELPLTSYSSISAWLRVAPSSPYMFPSPKNHKQPIRTQVVNDRLAHYGKIAGIENAHPHRFRATFATSALDAGIPLHEVQAAMHHSDPKTTLRYDRGVRGAGVTATLAQFRKKKED
jgi:integrase